MSRQFSNDELFSILQFVDPTDLLLQTSRVCKQWAEQSWRVAKKFNSLGPEIAPTWRALLAPMHTVIDPSSGHKSTITTLLTAVQVGPDELVLLKLTNSKDWTENESKAAIETHFAHIPRIHAHRMHACDCDSMMSFVNTDRIAKRFKHVATIQPVQIRHEDMQRGRYVRAWWTIRAMDTETDQAFHALETEDRHFLLAMLTHPSRNAGASDV